MTTKTPRARHTLTRHLEREKKYVLSAEHHGRLAAYLKRVVHPITQNQHTKYYSDPDAILASYKSAVRIRRITGITPPVDIFTLKQAQPAIGSTRVRFEFEADVTTSGCFESRLLDATTLPPHCLTTIFRRFAAGFRSAGIKSPRHLTLLPTVSSRNTRLDASVPCGLRLELDMLSTSTATYYELEVETGTFDDDRRRDEYIHLLFATLDIPVVSPVHYPSKYVRALLDGGIVRATAIQRTAMLEAHCSLRESHRTRCRTCRHALTPSKVTPSMAS